ncbi:MAG: hypothetical protein DRO14_00530 [Thermoprotei archaeon]|nr:MAG: hypothetical protein DRO14_00530 [Thermoprotei archaeon]
MTAFAVETALYNKLTSDTELMNLVNGVYRGIAPDDAVLPYIVINLISSTDSYTLGTRLVVGYHYQIRCVDEGLSKETADQAMARVDTLLTRQDLAVADGAFWFAERRGSFEFVENDSGVVYQHVIADFAIEVSE